MTSIKVLILLHLINNYNSHPLSLKPHDYIYCFTKILTFQLMAKLSNCIYQSLTKNISLFIFFDLRIFFNIIFTFIFSQRVHLSNNYSFSTNYGDHSNENVNTSFSQITNFLLLLLKLNDT